MSRPAACLFDLDGLLLDTEPCHGQAWWEAAAHFGLTLRPDQLLELRGRRRSDCVERVQTWISAAGQPAPLAEALLAIQQPIARRLLATAPAIEGAEQLLQRCLGLDLALALVSSSSREAVALKVAPHPWLAAIQLRILGDDPELGDGKPAPDPYLLAARRLGLPASACWAFEDSPAGARSAVAAGCRVHVLLPQGVSRTAYPAQVIGLTSLSQAEPLLELAMAA
jgi:pseudouridine 5'-phosphatase